MTLFLSWVFVLVRWSHQGCYKELFVLAWAHELNAPFALWTFGSSHSSMHSSSIQFCCSLLVWARSCCCCYLRCRVKNRSKFCLLLIQILKILFFLHGEFDLSKRPKRSKVTNYPQLKNSSNYVAQHAWTNFWLRLGSIFVLGTFTFVGHVWLFQNMSKPLFPQCFSKIYMFKAHPKNLETLFVNTMALTEKGEPSLYCFCVFAVSVFLVFLRRMKKKTTTTR